MEREVAMAKPKTPLSQLSYGLYVVGTKDGDAPHGMTANWLTQVSFEPELVALAVEKDAQSRRMIETSRVFSVSILKSGQKEIAGEFAKARKDKQDKARFIQKTTGAPILPDCAAYLDCRVVDSHPAGDHVIFFGEVVDSGILDESADPLTLKETGWRYGG
jgi:flavin reductase (DIM6/NTAB) family NADH-FMN oxidoreductase RutF